MLVVTPPQGRDLDNLTLEVLPHVHEILAPHPQPWLTGFPALSDAAEDRAERDRLRRLALGSATTPGSAWTRIAHYTDDRMEATRW